jgi:phosphonate transport system substrate-binding protein
VILLAKISRLYNTYGSATNSELNFMIKRPTRKFDAFYVLGTFLSSVLCGPEAWGQLSGRVEPKTFTLGIVSQIDEKEIDKHFREFAQYVARRLSSNAKIEGKVVTVGTPPRLASLLKERQADYYMESPYPTYVINDVEGAGTLLLRRWKGGMAEYRSLIFTKRDSTIRRLDDLRGKMIAFEDPDSTSGHFLPKFFLSRRGFKLAEKARIETNLPSGETGYIFASSQRALMDLVFTEQVAAGAFSDDDYAALGEKQKSELVVLAETERLPRHLLSIRKDLDPALAKQLKEVLLSMHDDPEGRQILAKTDQTTKFDTLPGGEAAMRRQLLQTFLSPTKK